ncbi:MAG: DUF3365 domain-containing protein [Proteobacteria bacterium]|nr:DUF3365 domain-containing protein [Pseudomonadota bacterium]
MTTRSLQKISKPRHLLLLAFILWSAAVGGIWMIIAMASHHTYVKNIALREARTYISRTLGIRSWVASHGGVYVPASTKTPPNPYLTHLADRDIELPNGKTLTLLNPAYMLRNLQESFAANFHIQSHITSLNPLRPENAANDWERRALESFTTGAQEFSEFTKDNDKDILHLMQPLFTQKSCLKCHGQQSYQEGDIRGGISVTIPLAEMMADAHEYKIHLALSLVGLWLLGLFGIWFFGRWIVAALESQDEANRNLKIHQLKLEETIQNRTKSLRETQRQLEEEAQERLKMQHAVEKSHGELQQIFDSAADGIRVVDWDYNMVMFNDTFARMAGGSRQVLTGRKCFEVFPGTSCHTPDCPLTMAKNGHEKSIHEATKTALTGNTMRCLTEASIFHDTDGKAMGILENYRDISKIKELEENLCEEAARNARQAVDLQQKNTDIISQNIALEQALSELKATQSQMLQNEKMATVGQLAAGVAHEINNPTGFVSSNLSSLEKYILRITDFLAQLQKVIPPENQEEIATLRKKMKIDHISDDIHDLIRESLDGTERIKKIVMSLKNFSRTDQEEYGAANINDCLDSTLNVVWNELKYKATVTKEYGELPLTKCYAQQLNQVFMNLLVNGAQAIAEQGVITIKTWCDSDNIFISISDTGSGMDEETMAHIFEPFYTTKKKDKGTGLGLSIAHDIITKKHQGRLCVESHKGQGTTFIIEIPIVSA